MAAIEERKNKKGEVVSYRFRVSLGYDVHGKQVTKQKTWKPLPNMTKTQIRKELNKQAQLFEMECMQGQCVDDNITFKQLYEMWWKEYATINLKKTTLKSYRGMIPNVLDAIGHLKLCKIQPHHLNEFYASLMGRDVKSNEAVTPAVDFREYILVHDGKKCNRPRMKQKDLAEKAGVSLTTLKVLLKGNPISVKCAQRIAEALELDYRKAFKGVKRKQVSVATVKRYNAMISGIFRHAVIQNIIPVNPCTRIRTLKSVKKEASYLDENEALRLFSELETAPEPYRTAARLCMFLGLRRGELCGLSWDDVDFERSLISVRRNVLYNSDDGLYEDTPKTYSSIRDIKVSDSIMGMLKEYKTAQKAYSDELGDKWEDTNKIFTNPMGGWLRPDSFSKWFSKFCKEKGFENTHAHTLRHTSATLMIMNGVPLRVVSQRLGHNSTTVTNDIYTHVIQRADEMAATALDKALFSCNKSDESIA